jgi:hypothetical protein
MVNTGKGEHQITNERAGKPALSFVLAPSERFELSTY